MPRFISCLAIAVASAFLVVATAAFSLPGSTKRCATAVGEGAMAVQLVHARLAERQQVQRIAAT